MSLCFLSPQFSISYSLYFLNAWVQNANKYFSSPQAIWETLTWTVLLSISVLLSEFTLFLCFEKVHDLTSVYWGKPDRWVESSHCGSCWTTFTPFSTSFTLLHPQALLLSLKHTKFLPVFESLHLHFPWPVMLFLPFFQRTDLCYGHLHFNVTSLSWGLPDSNWKITPLQVTL